MKKLTSLTKIMLVMALISFYYVNAQDFVSTDPQPRNAVLEEFTGIHCVYCPQGHAIAQALIDENPGRVIAINIHAGGYAVPNAGEPDFRTQWGEAFVSMSGLTGYPAGQVNREYFNGASALAMGRGSWESAVNQVINETTPSPVNVDFMTEYNSETRVLTIDLEMYYTSDAGQNNKLNIAVLESGYVGPQTGGGEDYVHNHILRDLITGQWGEAITETSKGSLVKKQYTYTLNEDWNEGTIDIVAFVTKADNKYIYTGVEKPMTPRYKVQMVNNDMYHKVGNGTAENLTFTVENPYDMALDVQIGYDPESISGDWSVNIPNDVVTIPANGSTEVTVDVVGGSTIAYNPVTITAKPINLEDPQAVGILAETIFGVLHSDTKNLYFIGFDTDAQYTAMTLLNNDRYDDNIAWLPLNVGTLQAYDANDYDFAMFSYNLSNSRYITSDQVDDPTVVNETMDFINTLLSNGKNVYITADIGLYYLKNSYYQGQNPQPNSKAQDLLVNKMGLNWVGLFNLVQNNQLYTLQVTGFDGTDFEGLSVDINKVYGQSFPVYVQYIETFELIPGAGTEKLMYYGDDESQLAMVGYTSPDGGKLVYSSFRLHAVGSSSTDQTQRDNVLSTVNAFFGEGTQTEGPKIATDVSDIDFGDTDVAVTETVTVSNGGDEDLVISAMSIDGDADYTVDFTSAVTIAAGENSTFDVTFTPGEAGIKTADLVITSNASNDTELRVSLTGNSTSSVDDGIAGINGKFTMSVGPNPMTETAYVTYNVNGNDKVLVNINMIDAAGNVVMNLVNDYKVSGEYKVEVESSNLSSGTYYLISNTNGVRTQLPLAIVK